MKTIPYLEPVIAKAVNTIIKKKKIVLATHDSNFHTDDICAAATLRTFFKLALPKSKYVITRNPVDSDILKEAELVFDTGMIYDPKTLRFDHHQTGGAGMYPNGIKYSSFGLIWKHFGASICALYSQSITGKLPSRQSAETQAKTVVVSMVAGVDAMDNGQNVFQNVFEGIEPLSWEWYVHMAKVSISSEGGTIEQMKKNLNKEFFAVSKLTESILETTLKYAHYREYDARMVRKMYEKAKDKRVIICDRLYRTDYAVFPETLFFIYPHTRGGWGAEVVRKKESSYEPRLAFPKEWGGKRTEDLVKVTGVKDAKFCHNGLFLVTAHSKEGAIEMVKLALKAGGF